jgi:hypothetical protein
MTTTTFKPVPPRGEPGKPGFVPEWQRVFANGFAPQLGIDGLRALRNALENNDPHLIQGATTVPPPLRVMEDEDVEAACAIVFCGWQGVGLTTVGQAEEFFARACYDCDQIMGESAACRHFLNWFDDTPRDEMRKLLLPVVRRVLSVYEQMHFDPQAAADEKEVA